MNLLRLILSRYALLALIVAVALSEALIGHWILRVAGLPGLGLIGLLPAVVGLGIANLALLAALRGVRRSPHAYRFGHAFVLGSLGAAFAGPPLLLFLILDWVLGATPAPAVGTLVSAGGGGAIALGFGAIAWGLLVGSRRLVVDEVELPVRGLSAELRSLRIAHITDLHIGRQLRGPQLGRYMARVNALEPDLIVITGDIFDFDPAFIEEGCRELAKLSAPRGVFACLGNHDVYTGAEAVASGIGQLTSIRLLRDERILVQGTGAPLYLAGVDDPGRDWTNPDVELAAIEQLASEVPGDGPTLLLAHRPSVFAQAARLGFPVVLSGHTHGGQICLPPPAHHHNLSRLVSRWTRGRFELGDSVLYVSRGLGTVGPPVRLNCPREISLLRLVPRT